MTGSGQLQGHTQQIMRTSELVDMLCHRLGLCCTCRSCDPDPFTLGGDHMCASC